MARAKKPGEPQPYDLLTSREVFRAQILPNVKAGRVGRRTLIPVVELERWLERHGARLSLA
jgi:hypothetical protein